MNEHVYIALGSLCRVDVGRDLDIYVVSILWVETSGVRECKCVNLHDFGSNSPTGE
jgi:hypothetical protein